MSAYYNEFDPKAAAWLRELIADGHIPPGEVDERDIRDIRPDELRPFRQCHFFAGIGGWPLALRQAGWPDGLPVWSGSPPCQSLSEAGARRGFLDERHLWPALYHLAEECGPPVLFGEQVASALGLAWLDLVSSDMEAAGYAGGAIDLCSAGFGSPNIRQRQFFVWVADSESGRCGIEWGALEPRHFRHSDGGCDSSSGMAYSDGGDASPEGLQRGWEHRQRAQDGGAGGMAHTLNDGRRQHGLGLDRASGAREGRRRERQRLRADPAYGGAALRPGPANGFWRDTDWIGCTDGKWRPVEPGTFPLASGIPGRVALLRGAGNAINVEVATAFVEEVMSVLQIARDRDGGFAGDPKGLHCEAAPARPAKPDRP